MAPDSGTCYRQSESCNPCPPAGSRWSFIAAFLGQLACLTGGWSYLVTKVLARALGLVTPHSVDWPFNLDNWPRMASTG